MPLWWPDPSLCANSRLIHLLNVAPKWQWWSELCELPPTLGFLLTYETPLHLLSAWGPCLDRWLLYTIRDNFSECLDSDISEYYFPNAISAILEDLWVWTHSYFIHSHKPLFYFVIIPLNNSSECGEFTKLSWIDSIRQVWSSPHRTSPYIWWLWDWYWNQS